MLTEFIRISLGDELYLSLPIHKILSLGKELLKIAISPEDIEIPETDLHRYEITRKDARIEGFYKESSTLFQQVQKNWNYYKGYSFSYREEKKESENLFQEYIANFKVILAHIPIKHCIVCQKSFDPRKEYSIILRGVYNTIKESEMNEKSGLFSI